MTGQQAGAPSMRRWRFGDVEFDERSLSLLRAGRAVEVERKPLLVLQHLLHHAGEVVNKDALIRAAWPGRIISDAALTKCVARLRDAIGDEAQSLVKTHYGFGYRMVAPVVMEGATTAPASANIRAANEAPILSRRGDAEQRPLTVLFCDLVGSTQLADTLDPEAFRDLLLGYQRRAAEICRRYEGHVAQQFGDGMMFYFGYPAAHDDDAERALRCACDLLAQFKSGDAVTPRLALRIGVHTGAVVIGQTDAARDPIATGPSLHLAARLQALAEPDTLLASDSTFRLVPGLFVSRDYGPQMIRGLSEPVRVHQVLQASGVRSRLEAAARLTPFVGREAEIGVLSEGWREAVRGEGRAILLCGEPGLGKSRLLMEIRARLAGSAYSWLECRADALNRHSAWHPLVELLRRGLDLKPQDDEARRLERLEHSLRELGLECIDGVPLLAPLLGITLPEHYATPTPALRRQRTLESFADWIEQLAHRQPLAIAFEDLHWIDDSSLAFLGVLIERLARLPVLLVMTTRPEFVSPWPARASLHLRTLEPLLRPDVERMLRDLTGGALPTPALAQLIFERAGGVPLFVEELTRSLVESGQLIENGDRLDARVPLRDLSIPGSLHGLLLARLDRLGPARELIQTAAVIGRDAPYRLLHAVAGLDEVTLRQQLQRLVESGLLHARPDASYIFKHALIRDSAYETLLKTTREKLHGHIARALETHFPERAETEPEVLAAHFEKAGLADSAVRYLIAAAERGEAATSMAETIAHCEHALRLLPQLAPTPQPARMEMDLNLRLANCRMATSGYGHEDVERIFLRVRELAEDQQDPVLTARALCQLSVMHWNRAEFPQALETADRIVALGRTQGDETVPYVGLASRGRPLLHLGRLVDSVQTCEQAYALVTPQLAAAVLRILPYDVHNYSLIPIMHAQWLMGRPDSALATLRKVLAQSTAAQHPHAIAWSLAQGMLPVLILRREPDAALEHGCRAVALCERHGLVELLAHAQQSVGLAYLMLGRFDQGMPLLRASDLARQGYRTEVMNSMHAVIEAEQYRRHGRLDDARAALRRAFELMEKTGERFWEAELHRVQGELLLVGQGPRATEAEACFEKAAVVSRAQGALSLELRVAASLARLRQQQHRRQDARAVLGSVYDRFTEGFDTADLREATDLLAALG